MAIITAESLRKTYETFKDTSARARRYAVNGIAAMAAMPVDSDEILRLYERMADMRTAMQSAAAVSGITAYAQDEESNPTYDVVAEINAIVTLIDAAITWIDTNFPKTNGYWQTISGADGALTPRAFSVNATANLRAALQNIVNAIAEPA